MYDDVYILDINEPSIICHFYGNDFWQKVNCVQNLLNKQKMKAEW